MKLEWKKIGEVGVDSDLNKAVPEGWHEFCDKYLGLAEEESKSEVKFAAGHKGLGVVAPTAYGDGYYAVYGLFSGAATKPLAMLVVTGGDIVELPDVPAEIEG